MRQPNCDLDGLDGVRWRFQGDVSREIKGRGQFGFSKRSSQIVGIVNCQLYTKYKPKDTLAAKARSLPRHSHRMTLLWAARLGKSIRDSGLCQGRCGSLGWHGRGSSCVAGQIFCVGFPVRSRKFARTRVESGGRNIGVCRPFWLFTPSCRGWAGGSRSGED